MKLHLSQYLDALLSYAPLTLLAGVWLFLSTGIVFPEKWPEHLAPLVSGVLSLPNQLLGLGIWSILCLFCAHTLVVRHLKFSSSNPESVRELLAEIFKAIGNRPNINNEILQKIKPQIDQVKNRGYLSSYGESLIIRTYKEMCNLQTSNAEAEDSHLSEQALTNNNLLRSNALSALNTLESELNAYKKLLHKA